MERMRCSRCRNPIRSGAAVTVGEDEAQAWFHTDCWVEVQHSRQAEYREEVAARGLAALIAPYSTHKETAASVG